MAAILLSRMEVCYCTSGFFRSYAHQAISFGELPFPRELRSRTHVDYCVLNHAVTIMCAECAKWLSQIRRYNNSPQGCKFNENQRINSRNDLCSIQTWESSFLSEPYSKRNGWRLLWSLDEFASLHLRAWRPIWPPPHGVNTGPKRDPIPL